MSPGRARRGAQSSAHSGPIWRRLTWARGARPASGNNGARTTIRRAIVSIRIRGEREGGRLTWAGLSRVRGRSLKLHLTLLAAESINRSGRARACTRSFALAGPRTTTQLADGLGRRPGRARRPRAVRLFTSRVSGPFAYSRPPLPCGGGGGGPQNTGTRAHEHTSTRKTNCSRIAPPKPGAPYAPPKARAPR